MKPDYLTLADGRTVRVAFNMNALGAFASLTGKELSDLFANRYDYNLLRTLAWCSVIEGENIEGRQFELTEVQFGQVMNMVCIGKFSQILTVQITSGVEKKSETKGKKPVVHLREEKITGS